MILWVDLPNGRARVEIPWIQKNQTGSTRVFKKLSDLEIVKDDSVEA